MGGYLSIFSQDNISQINEKYIGTFRKFNEEPFLTNHKQYKELPLTFKGTWDLKEEYGPNYGRQFCYKLPNLTNYDNERFVYKNLRFSSNKFNKVIESCELSTNGERVDKIYNNLFLNLREFYNITDDCVIPFHFCKDFLPGSESTNYCVTMVALTQDKFKDEDLVDFKDLKVLVDVYSYNSEKELDLEYMTTHIEFCGANITDKQTDTFDLMFKQVSNQLIVYCEDTKVEELSLFLYGINSGISLADLDNYDSHDNNDNHYIIKFSDNSNFTGLNFGNIYPIDYLEKPDSQIKLTMDKSDKIKRVHFYNLCWQPVKFVNGKLILQ